jgi:hypothetical protein
MMDGTMQGPEGVRDTAGIKRGLLESALEAYDEMTCLEKDVEQQQSRWRRVKSDITALRVDLKIIVDDKSLSSDWRSWAQTWHNRLFYLPQE